MQTISFIIGADLVPTKSNFELFTSANVNALFGQDLMRVLKESDFRIFNLETPLTDEVKPIKKCGPNLAAPTTTINGIKALNPTLLGLSNNHILDQDQRGLFSTIEILKQANIAFVGAGANLAEASRPHIIERQGVRIGIYACAEHEFSIATGETSGANPFDSLESLDHIVALKEECDYVFVLYHGGKEHHRYPSPYLQKVCRKMAQKGADLVICQHSHCIGCCEDYKGSTIIYGQGNFIFDDDNSEFWQTSLLIKVGINDGLYLEYIPLVKADNGVRLANKQKAEDILLQYHQRSSDILKAGFIEKKFEQFAAENILFYIRHFAGFGKWLSRLDRRLFNGWLTRNKFNKEQSLTLKNFIECEAHRELVLAGLRGEK